MKVLVISAAFPSSVDPSRGLFVKERVKALANLPGVDVEVIAPTPWAPPLRAVDSWYARSQFPRKEVIDGLTVHRPRYPLPPKVGGYFHPSLMYHSTLQAARRVREEFEFDVIDSHFVYPSGVVAIRLSKHFNVPACTTGRGADMLKFPELPLKSKAIRWALTHGDGFVGVSDEIADRMRQFGAPADRIEVIPNGVDTNRFKPYSSSDCREKLGLPTESKILITVGDLLELKGFHVVIEALPQIVSRYPNVLYLCVGGSGRHGGDYRRKIESRIRELNLENHVRMIGALDQADLPDWYNAADLYVLASSREGSPNALLESLSCGTPAVATRVGSAPDELEGTGFGLIMKDRTASAAADAIVSALSFDWDCDAIRTSMEQRSWHNTAQQVQNHLQKTIQSKQ